MRADHLTYIDDQGGQLAVRTFGAGDRVVLATHGIAGFGVDWLRTAECLGDDWTVHALDLPGFGRSAERAPDDYTPPALADTVTRVRHGLDLETVLLVGHSYGARPAYLSAAREPAGVLGAVAVDAGPEAGPGLAKVKERLATWPEEFGTTEEAAEQYRGLFSQEDDARFQRRMEEYLTSTPAGTVRLRRDPWWREQWATTTAGSAPPWDEWRAVPVPVLIVRGGRSPMLTSEVARRMVQENPRARETIIEGAGHNIPLEAPEALAAEISRFFDACADGLATAETGRMAGPG